MAAPRTRITLKLRSGTGGRIFDLLFCIAFQPLMHPGEDVRGCEAAIRPPPRLRKNVSRAWDWAARPAGSDPRHERGIRPWLRGRCWSRPGPLDCLRSSASPMASGRTTANTFDPSGVSCGRRDIPAIAIDAQRQPVHSGVDDAVLSTRLASPRNVATKRAAGCRYKSSAVPICTIWPAFMMAMRSEIAMASSWSCVT